MKYGVLGFSYACFPFASHVRRTGFYSTNLGDNAQTIASRRLFSNLGIPESEIVVVDRDTLPTYGGPPVKLLMNGVFRPDSFPVPDNVTPILVGFTVNDEKVVVANRSWLQRHEPVGCRDNATTELMRRHGIAAYTSGCVTFTLPVRLATPKDGKLLIVYGSGAGELPPGALKKIPDHLIDGAEFIYHRLPAIAFPPTDQHLQLAEAYESALLDRYRTMASLVLTPLHHVAAPCMAMGIPTIVCRKDVSSRFSLLKELTRVYTPDDLDEIDWNPTAVEVQSICGRYVEAVRAHVGDEK